MPRATTLRAILLYFKKKWITKYFQDGIIILKLDNIDLSFILKPESNYIYAIFNRLTFAY